MDYSLLKRNKCQTIYFQIQAGFNSGQIEGLYFGIDVFLHVQLTQLETVFRFQLNKRLVEGINYFDSNETGYAKILV